MAKNQKGQVDAKLSLKRNWNKQVLSLKIFLSNSSDATNMTLGIQVYSISKELRAKI
jgi:hypothetical protein